MTSAPGESIKWSRWPAIEMWRPRPKQLSSSENSSLRLDMSGVGRICLQFEFEISKLKCDDLLNLEN